KIERQVKGTLVSGRGLEIRGIAAEADADVGILLSVHNQGGGDQNVGAIKVGQLCLPVLVFKFKKKRAQDGWLVQARIGEGFHVFRFDLWTGLGRILRAEAGRTESARRSGEELADGGAKLGLIELAVLVLVSFFEEGFRGRDQLLDRNLAGFLAVRALEDGRGEKIPRSETETARRTKRTAWAARPHSHALEHLFLLGGENLFQLGIHFFLQFLDQFFLLGGQLQLL